MIRKAFVMQLLPGAEEEYHRRHNPIWPDLASVLRVHGVHRYSIFLHPHTLQLFATVEYENQILWDAIAQTEICQRWWLHMSGLMDTNPDASPTTLELPRLFNLESQSHPL